VVVEVPSQSAAGRVAKVDDGILIAAEPTFGHGLHGRAIPAGAIPKPDRFITQLEPKVREHRCAGDTVETVAMGGDYDFTSSWALAGSHET